VPFPEPPDVDSMETDEPGSFFDNVTPIFGIGIFVGAIVLFKIKKK